MDQQGLRDVDRWKDKIEVRLDNRQVAFLFFGSALVACMLFILGVIVGKRLESRGRALAPEIEDPLALLDRVAATTPPPAPAAPVEEAPPPPTTRNAKGKREAAAAAPAVVDDDPLDVPGPAQRPDPNPGETPAKAAVAPERAVDRLALKTPPAHSPPDPSAPAPVTPPAQKPAAAPAQKPTIAPSEVKSADIMPPSFETKPATTAAAIPPGAPVTATKDAAKDAGKKPRFMLQVGSFPDKAEAEAYAGTLAGERPVVVMSEIPGKGIWYRVRLGSFQAFKDAVDAKTVFERRYNKIALVVGPL